MLQPSEKDSIIATIKQLNTCCRDQEIIKDLLLRLADESFLCDLTDESRLMMLYLLKCLGMVCVNKTLKDALFFTLTAFNDAVEGSIRG